MSVSLITNYTFLKFTKTFVLGTRRETRCLLLYSLYPPGKGSKTVSHWGHKARSLTSKLLLPGPFSFSRPLAFPFLLPLPPVACWERGPITPLAHHTFQCALCLTHPLQSPIRYRLHETLQDVSLYAKTDSEQNKNNSPF